MKSIWRKTINWKGILTIATFFLIAISSQAQWVQKGESIIGSSAYYHAGSSVALNVDGNIMAVGISKGDEINEPGMVQTMIWNGTAWEQRGQWIVGDNNSDFFGVAVELSSDGNTMIIGAPGYGMDITNNGYARVVEWNGEIWVDKGSDILSEAVSDQERFGSFVSISSDGNTVAIGGYGADDNGINSGVSRIYHWNGTEWIKRGNDIEGENEQDHSGTLSLSADGLTVAIAARWNNNAFNHAGQVRVFHWDGSAWTLKGNSIYGQETQEFIGYSVSIDDSGDFVAIGAVANLARVYQYVDGTWVQNGSDIVGEMPDDYAGFVSLSGDGSRIAIGAPNNNGGGMLSGHVRVLEYGPSEEWIQSGEDIYGESIFDSSGRALCIAGDGQSVAIGVPLYGNGQLEVGHVRVFTMDPNVGIAENTEESMVVYPNPSNGSVTIQTTQNISEISIYFIEGKKVFQQPISTHKKHMTISNLHSGFYLIVMTSEENNITTCRLVVN